MLPEFETIARTAAVAFVLLVPGAAAAAGFEWHAVRYSRRGRDWGLRLLLFSGVWLAAGFWVWHSLALRYWDDLADRKPVSWWVYLVPLGFVFAPYVVGWGLGWLTTKHPRRMRRLLGVNRAPTAWDQLFGSREAGFVRCRLRSGRWVGGLYGNAEPIPSYASTGDERWDVYIAKAVFFDEAGVPVRDDEGDLWLTGSGILLESQEIESLEFIAIADPADGG